MCVYSTCSQRRCCYLEAGCICTIHTDVALHKSMHVYHGERECSRMEHDLGAQSGRPPRLIHVVCRNKPNEFATKLLFEYVQNAVTAGVARRDGESVGVYRKHSS